MKYGPEDIEKFLASARGLAGGIEPTEAQLRALLSADLDGPLQYLNLLAFKDVARYPEGHELVAAELTGAEAYARYGAVAIRHVGARGGRLVAFNRAELTLIGEPIEWDQVVLMEYPNREAFLDMIQDPDYQAATVHRRAGLERTTIVVGKTLLSTGA